MNKLTASNLPQGIRSFNYDRDAVKTGVVHFGIGNFHRAHQAVYCEDLLEQGKTNWGITGISLRSSSMKNALEPQDYLYTLSILGETTQHRVIGAIKDVIVAPTDPRAVIDLIANPNTQVVSSTITEKGYCLGPNGIDLEHPNIKRDFESLNHPITIFGFLAAGIIERNDSTGPRQKMTVMCCDNISSGGEILHQGVTQLLKQHNERALEWAKDNVSFISSMVDRVSPATDDNLRDRVFIETGRKDANPVSAEPFSQWIIEDNFAGEKPNFESVGAVFADDIAPFERMKLQYLNAAHTIVSSIGYLLGDKYVHEALRRPEILKFTRLALEENVRPVAAVPAGYDSQKYIEDVIARFQNENLPYGNLQVGTDSSQKIQQRWFPTLDQAIQRQADSSYLQFAIGAWVNFIRTALKNNDLNDPKKVAFQGVATDSLGQRVTSYLEIADVDQFEFSNSTQIIDGIIHHALSIEKNGISQALSNFLETHPTETS